MPRRSLSRPCIDCGTLTTNTRCNLHRSARARATRNPAYDSPEYRRNRKTIIERHVAQYGWICPGDPALDHEAHPCTDLTADHIISLSAGGTNHITNLRPLCQSANSSKGGTNR